MDMRMCATFCSERSTRTQRDDARGGTPLHLACYQGHVDVVRFLVSHGADVDHKDSVGGWTSLHIGAQVGNLAIVELLLRERAAYRLSRRKEDGYTPLMVACRSGKGGVGVAEYMLRNGADVSQSLEDGTTALLVAAKMGRLHHVELLIRMCGVGILGQVSNFKWNCLHLASRGGHDELVAFLLAQRVFDVNSTCSNEMSSLYIASHHGHAACVDLLIRNGADVDAKNYNGASALYTACKHGHVHVARTLVSAGADVNVRNSRGSTPLLTACNHKHLEIVRFLIASGADTRSAKGAHGWVSLHLACRQGELSIVRALVEEGRADVDAKTREVQYTPLHVAAAQNWISIVRYLVAKGGANVSLMTSAGETASTLASQRSHTFLSTWLRNAEKWGSIEFACDDADTSEMVRLFRDGAKPVAALRDVVEASIESNQKKAEAIRLLGVCLQPWSPANHYLFPRPARETVFVVLLVFKRLNVLPKEVVFYMLSYLGRAQAGVDAMSIL